MKGNIHSFESFGTSDGPGIRFIVFFQGCLARCVYCHNPDTWTMKESKLLSTDDIVTEALKYKNYYGDDGGVTISGGEPLLQLDFLIELVKKLKENNLNVVIDTSGMCYDTILNDKYIELIKYVDIFMVDIKHIDKEKHIKITSKSNEATIAFLSFLNDHQKDIWIRYVLVPSLTDDLDDIIKLKQYINTLKCIKRVDVLPFHKLGLHKYEKLNMEYLVKDINVPTTQQIEKVTKILKI